MSVRRSLCLLCALLGLWLPAARAEVYFADPPADWYVRPLLRLTAFDAAQSDCLLLQCGGESMMVDGGAADYAPQLVEALTRRGVTRFKYLLNTHYHKDHIGGLCALMRYGLAAGAYLHPYPDSVVRVSRLHADTLAQAQASGVPVQQVFHGDELPLGEAVIQFARYDEGRSTNGKSLVLRVQFGGAVLLLGADIIGDTQSWLVRTMPDNWLKADVLKAPHHAVSPMAADFLQAVSPEAVLITNDHKRSAEAQPQLAARGIPAVYTGDGCVVIETDGDDWYVFQHAGRFD